MNNYQEVMVTVPKEGAYITENCKGGQDSDKRNCGFERQGNLLNCTPGATVKLNCTVANGAAPQVLRVCETSRALNSAVACTYRDARTNVVVESKGVNVSFVCPEARDAVEVGGQYSMLTAPFHLGDSKATINCTVR